jgi:hypothetical protein
MAQELSELQANTPAEAPQSIRATVESELGRPVEALFAQFDPRAFASASIGQVHRARLHGGQEVVVKVQHRDIEEKVQRDLDILKALADLGEKHSSELRRYRPKATLNEFRRSITREMDFRRELRNLQEFIRNFRSDPTVRFPTPYPELPSRRVLTMEYLDGVSIGEPERLRHDRSDRLARGGFRVGRLARCQTVDRWVVHRRRFPQSRRQLVRTGPGGVEGPPGTNFLRPAGPPHVPRNRGGVVPGNAWAKPALRCAEMNQISGLLNRQGNRPTNAVFD